MLRVTVDRRVVKSHDASTVVGVVNKLDRRRVLMTTRSTAVAKFSKYSVWDKVPDNYHYFGDIRISVSESKPARFIQPFR